MGTDEGNHDDLLDKSSQKEESKTTGDTTIHSETESGVPNNANDPYKGTRGTGVFKVPDPLDPAMRARVDAAEKVRFDFVEFDGTCDQCGRGMNDGRPEAQCSTCGVIMHQFCFDAHVIQNHRPPAVTARIVHKDGKFFAKIRKVSE